MGLRLCVALLLLGLSRTADADIIQLVSNGTFVSDLSDWTTTTTSVTAGEWIWADEPPTLLALEDPGDPTGVALLVTDGTAPFEGGTMRLIQTFAPFTDDPSLTTSAIFEWEQFMTTALDDWGPGQQFRVFLEDQSSTVSTLFTRNSGVGATGPETQSMSVLGFLQQLASGESFSVIFEALTSAPMTVEIDNVSLVVDAPAATPEPGSFLLCSLAGVGYFANRRRRRRNFPAAV